MDDAWLLSGSLCSGTSCRLMDHASRAGVWRRPKTHRHRNFAASRAFRVATSLPVPSMSTRISSLGLCSSQ